MYEERQMVELFEQIAALDYAALPSMRIIEKTLEKLRAQKPLGMTEETMERAIMAMDIQLNSLTDDLVERFATSLTSVLIKQFVYCRDTLQCQHPNEAFIESARRIHARAS